MIRKIWEDTFSSEAMGVLGADKEDVSEIVDVFIENKIDPQVFLANLKILLQADGHDFGEDEYQIPASPSNSMVNTPETYGGSSYWSVVNRPVYMPLWFLAAYPEVIIWANKENEETQKFMQALESGKDIEGSSTRKIQPRFLKKIVKGYQDITGKILEVTIRNPEDDVYAGFDVLNKFGYDSNFALIAENTTKYYLELKKYSHRFSNEVSLLAAAGIVDAQFYILANQQMTVMDILDMARKSVEANDEPLVDFVVRLEAKIFEIDTPKMDPKEIKDICEDQRHDINSVIQKTKNTYLSEVKISSEVAAFMELDDLRGFRDMIGIRD